MPVFTAAAIPPRKKITVSQGKVWKCESSQYPTTNPPTRDMVKSMARAKKIPNCSICLLFKPVHFLTGHDERGEGNTLSRKIAAIKAENPITKAIGSTR